jgi:hypothetical protein
LVDVGVTEPLKVELVVLEVDVMLEVEASEVEALIGAEVLVLEAFEADPEARLAIRIVPIMAVAARRA